jgi:cytochrome c-type biogenesis protein CcmE
MVAGSVKRDANSLQVSFSIYDAEGSVDVSYEGILPDLFREGQGVVVQGERCAQPDTGERSARQTR